MFIKHEAELLAVLKASLLNMYGSTFKTLNINDSSLVTEQASQKLLSYFNRKSSTSQSPTVSQAKLSDETTNEATQRIKKRFRKRNDNSEDSETDEDESEAKSNPTQKDGAKSSKIPKIDKYFETESILGKEVHDTIGKPLLDTQDKENMFGNVIGGRISTNVKVIGELVLISDYYLFGFIFIQVNCFEKILL